MIDKYQWAQSVLPLLLYRGSDSGQPYTAQLVRATNELALLCDIDIIFIFGTQLIYLDLQYDQLEVIKSNAMLISADQTKPMIF